MGECNKQSLVDNLKDNVKKPDFFSEVYFDAAEILHGEVLKAEKICSNLSNRDEVILADQQTAFGMSRVLLKFPRNYLYSLSVEMLLKQIVKNGGLLDDKYQHHRIPRLFDVAKENLCYYPCPLSIIEKVTLLKKIEIIIAWAGRYPHPKTNKSNTFNSHYESVLINNSCVDSDKLLPQFNNEEIILIRRFIVNCLNAISSNNKE